MTLKTYSSITAILILVIASGSTFLQPSHSDMKQQPHSDPEWEAFEMKELQNQRAESGRNYLPFMDMSTLSMGLYELEAGATDGQPVHDLDEVYQILEGDAVLLAGEKRIQVGPGSVVYVRAGVEHRFVDIESDLSVLVFFSTAAPEKQE